MKTLFIFFSCLLCFASAAFYDVLDQESNDLVSDFRLGMDNSPSLAIIDPDFAEQAIEIERDVKSQLAKALQDVLDKAIGHIQEAAKRTEILAKNLIEKATEMLKELSGSAEELRERIRGKIQTWVLALVARLQDTSANYELVRVPLELDEKNLMENVRQNILERLNLKELVDYVKNKLAKLGEVGQALLNALHRPGALQNLKDLLQMLLPGQGMDYSLKDIWGKVKDFFQNVAVKISDKFYLFADWMKDAGKSGWAQITDKAGKLKEMAGTVAAKAKTMTKQVAQQALDFFQEHKSEIGEVLWKVVKGALTTAISTAVASG